MMRNADYIMDNYIIDDEGLAKKAQVGVDLTVSRISRVSVDPAKSFAGRIYNDESASLTGVKADFATYSNMTPKKVIHAGADVEMFDLMPGCYSIEFDQGLKALKNNDTAFIIQRSTLLRNGTRIVSSVYDPGFETPAIGAFIFVSVPIQIEKHARVAQIVVHENEEAELYAGTYQGANDFR